MVTGTRPRLRVVRVPMLRRLVVLALVASAALLPAVSPARAATSTPGPGFTIRVTGDIVVPGGTTMVGTAVTLNGNITVDGRLEGDAVTLNGDIGVRGEVTGSVRTLNGSVTVYDTGRVGGDATAFNGVVTVLPGGRVAGQVRRGVVQPATPTPSPGVVPPPGVTPPATPPAPPPVATPTPLPPPPAAVPPPFDTYREAWWRPLRALLFVFKLSFLVVLGGLGVLLVALLPDTFARLADTVQAWPLHALLAGIGWWVALAAGAVVLAVSLVGIPLLVLLPALVGALSLVGYATMAFWVGRRLQAEVPRPVRQATVGAVVVGVAALIPVVGNVVLGLVLTWGIGTVLTAVYLAVRRPAPPPPPAPPPRPMV